MTDAISFKMLCRDQLEYIRDNTDFKVSAVTGGSYSDIEDLINRNIGDVYNAGLVRHPSPFQDLKSLFFLTKYLYLNRFDLVVYSTPKAMLIGSMAAFLTMHKNKLAIVQGRAYENFKGRKRLFYQLLDKLTFSISDDVIFVSHSLKSAYLNESIISSNKAHVINSGSFNGVDVHKFKLNRTRDDSEFNIIVAGRVCLDKGLLDLKEIIKRVKSHNIQFKIVGPIEDETSAQLLSEITSQNLNIEYVSYTNNIEYYFMKSDLHLFLSHREGFGNVAIEAASCGVPTFAYDVIGIKDSVKNGISGQKFRFQDYDAIAAAIDDAASDSSFRNQYLCSRNWVIKNFEQEKVWKGYLDFYESLL